MHQNPESNSTQNTKSSDNKNSLIHLDSYTSAAATHNIECNGCNVGIISFVNLRKKSFAESS